MKKNLSLALGIAVGIGLLAFQAHILSVTNGGTGATTFTKYYPLAGNGTSPAQSVAPSTYPAEMFGVVADGSTDNTGAINAAAIALTAIGPGNRLLLPVGETKVTSGTLQLKGMILVGSGAPGWNGGSLSEPSSYLHITYDSGTTASIQCLQANPCGLDNLKVINDASNSPFMEYTCGIPWLDNVMFRGKVSRTSGGGTGVPTNDGILFGDAPGDTSSSCNTTAAGFSGYGSNHIYNLYFRNIRTFLQLFDNANGLSFYGIRGDFTDANTSGYAIYINGSTNPAYGNKFYGNFEQAANGGGAGSCNYQGVFGLDNQAQSNYAVYQSSDVGDCTHSTYILSTSAGGNFFTAMVGQFSGGAFSDVSTSYGNMLIDMPNRSESTRTMNLITLKTKTTTWGPCYSAAGTSLPACGSATLLQRACVSDATSALPGTAYTASGTYTIAVQCTFNSSGSVYTWIID